MSSKLIERINTREYGETWIDQSGRYHQRLHTCPACGKEIDQDYTRELLNHLLFDHRPEDFGLTPI